MSNVQLDSWVLMLDYMDYQRGSSGPAPNAAAAIMRTYALAVEQGQQQDLQAMVRNLLVTSGCASIMKHNFQQVMSFLLPEGHRDWSHVVALVTFTGILAAEVSEVMQETEYLEAQAGWQSRMHGEELSTMTKSAHQNKQARK